MILKNVFSILNQVTLKYDNINISLLMYFLFCLHQNFNTFNKFSTYVLNNEKIHLKNVKLIYIIQPLFEGLNFLTKLYIY